MAVTRTYGTLQWANGKWVLSGITPNIAIRLKQIFPRIAKTEVQPFVFPDDDMHCADLSWFLSRYPMAMSAADRSRLDGGRERFEAMQTELEAILTGDFVPPAYVGLKNGQTLRSYQAQAVEVARRSSVLLLGDDLGLGKTYSAIGLALSPGMLPMAVVVQTHLQNQWEEKITTFSTLRVHKIKGTKPYPLPPADVYLFKYTQLAGWADVFATAYFKAVAYDEVQELRRGTESLKGRAARVLSTHASVVMGLSATPIFGYGSEIWNIYHCMGSDVLGSAADFNREWTDDDRKVKDPDALGAYLREQHVFLRRLKRDVGQEMAPVNVIHEFVESDGDAIKSIETLARQLARRALTGSFTERGQAGRELDMLLRQATGVGKARYVAAYTKVLLEAGIPVLLCGWHREVYSRWLEDLKEFNPVMYTGTESPKQKDESVRAFLAGETNLFIMSLRSGAGLDGLQARCSTVVFGELDWSKKIHEQIIGRLDREGQQDPVMAIYLTSEDGSDPPILDVLAVKESQSRGIVDPGKAFEVSHSDDSRVKALAKAFLGRREYAKLATVDGVKVAEPETTDMFQAEEADTTV